METSFIWVYITAPNKEEAKNIARELVKSKLIACANILDGLESIYHWEGQIQEDQEALIIAKTKKDNFAKIEESVKSLHSYSCPCIIALPIIQGHNPYLNWIVESLN